MTKSTTRKSPRTLTLRYAAVCRRCGEPLPAGTTASWSYEARAATCLGCLADPDREPSETADPFARTRSRGYFGRDAGRCEDAPCCGCCS